MMGPFEVEFTVEPLCATMVFRSVPCGAGVVLAGGDSDRLVVLGDVRSREVRVLSLRQAREEAEDARCLRVWRGL